MSSLVRNERNDGVSNLPRGQQQPSSQGRTYVSVVQNLGPPQQTQTKNGINGMRADALSTPNASRLNTITSPLVNNGSSAEDRGKGKQIGGRVEGATNYDKETVLTLLKLMPEAGYLNRKRLKMSVKDVFAEAVNMAESRHGIKRSAQGWRRKFHRIRMDYKNYLKRLSTNPQQTNNHPNDLPDFFHEINTLEKSSINPHRDTTPPPPVSVPPSAPAPAPGPAPAPPSDPSAIIGQKRSLPDAEVTPVTSASNSTPVSGGGTAASLAPTSSSQPLSQRPRLSEGLTLEEVDRRCQKRHETTIGYLKVIQEAMKKSSEDKARLSSIIQLLLERGKND